VGTKQTPHSNTSCESCESGTTSFNGATECQTCNKGEFEEGNLCLECPSGWHGPEIGKTVCETCPLGWEQPQPGSESCIDLNFKKPQDCHLTTQYLDSSDSDPSLWLCRSCPSGGTCNGPTAWKDVRAKFGYFRLEEATLSPPACLLEIKHVNDTEPKCAFQKCLYPPACLGAKNDEYMNHFFGPSAGVNGADDVNIDLSQVITTPIIEKCDEANGYRHYDNHSNKSSRSCNGKRCRLCATCKVGYKRASLSSARCKKCPDPTTNKILLGVGFIVVCLGSICLIWLTIQSEGGSDATSDAVKKIILNFLQIASLAGGLPLQWPPIVEALFTTMATLASAGSTLLIPDCELTKMKTVEAFYLKQTFYTFLVPGIFLVVLVGWYLVWSCCGRCRKLNKHRVKDYVILTLVLMLFLCYPMLVKLCLSTLQCPNVGGTPYLLSDLEEPCFKNRHLMYIFMLTLPQLVLYVFGLPALASFILMREEKIRLFTSFSFRMRYVI